MSFTSLGLIPELQRAVAEQGYTTATPIQLQAIPLILERRDMLAGAQTGTGKTAGFTLPMLQLLAPHANTGTSPARHPVRALIMTPTRELAAQVAESVAVYGKYLPLRSAVVFGGVNIRPQIDEMRRGVDVLIATPGRLLDHIEQKSVNLSQVEILILDEADRMLDMGFIHDIKRIVSLLPKQRQSLLFSATFSTEIKKLADEFLKNPALIAIARENITATTIAQSAYAVEKKREFLGHLIRSGDWQQVLVFMRTKHGASRLAQQLVRDGISATAIHGNKSQPQRTLALEEFKQGKCRVLVATDVAARGLDIEELPHVINYELPYVAEDYVHRIGRTGRAGSQGTAISLVGAEERHLLSAIEKLIGIKLPLQEPQGFAGAAGVGESGSPPLRSPRREHAVRDQSQRGPKPVRTPMPARELAPAPKRGPRDIEPPENYVAERIRNKPLNEVPVLLSRSPRRNNPS